ncbi:unnamed protein product [Pleuronectes platessa]|uniref:Uncharacterized protein n=1 Tax=Pleuronectes platessa TaxID=8262 RepID=A0A9N7W304_PLEPL|nr:unnamed protein product [Pleuronectes platessa]
MSPEASTPGAHHASRHTAHTRDLIYPAAPKRPGPQILFTQSPGNHQVLRGSGRQQKQIPQIKNNRGGREGRSAKVLPPSRQIVELWRLFTATNPHVNGASQTQHKDKGLL